MMLHLPMGGGLILAAIIALIIWVPNPLRTTIMNILKIRGKRVKKAVFTPIERELAMVAGPQKIIADSETQVRDLQGMLVHESNMLLQRQDDLTEAEAQYYRAVDDKTDTGIDELVQLVADKEQEVSLQQGVVDGTRAAVENACKAVDKARKELRQVQMTIKSDEAKARATAALDAAARVMEAARSMTANGGALKEVSGEVNRDYMEARARVDGLGGTPVERELAKIDEAHQLSELRKRLDAKRPVKPASAQSQS